MARHRNIRNLTEDDYYDDDYYDEDDYYEEEEDYQPRQAPTMSVQPTPQSKPIVKAGKVATNVSVGVTKPPPGWGKPAPPAKAKSPPGVSAPPQGWGKPTETAARPTPETKSPQKTSPSTATLPTKPTSAPTKAIPKENKLPNFLQANNQRSQLSMVVLGHVDAGKSTLMGQVLVQVGQVRKRAGAGNLSWLLDENESERQRGVTMEIGTKGMTTEHHDIVILDAPGHADFIPIMITGAANADVAILVVAAVTGEFEAGFVGGGQTKEHMLLAKGLGVTQVIVAINKLDVDGWDQTRYDSIQAQVKEYLLKQQFGPKRIRFVPISGLTGENVKERKDPKLSAWYKGPTLLEAMDTFKPANRQADKPLRFVVTDLYAEGKGVVARGRVNQGFVQVGDRVSVLPIGDIATVSKLDHVVAPSSQESWSPTEVSKRLSIALAGDSVDLVLAGIDPVRVSVGNILSDYRNDRRPPMAKTAKVKLLVMESLSVPIIRGAQVLFHMHSLDVPAVLTKLIATTKRDGSIKKERPRALTAGSSAIVEVTLSDKIVMEPFSQCRSLGRFVLRRSGDTIAVGVIDEVVGL